MQEEKFIDVIGIIRSRAPKLYRWAPMFVLRWLKNKLHEDAINKGMRMLKDVRGLEFNSKTLDYAGAKVVPLHRELIPARGKVTVISNHPLGGLDGLALIKAVGDVRPDVHFLVNDILKNVTNFGDIFVAVNKLGAVSTSSLRSMQELFDAENAVLVFPAGLVSRKQQGVIRDLSWKKTFVTQSIEHHRLIQPAFIEGSNSRFFYNFALWRKRLGIKGNIEMLWLPDEMFSAKKKDIRIHFSKPFPSEILHSGKSHKEWADILYDYTYSTELREGVSFEEYLQKKKLG